MESRHKLNRGIEQKPAVIRGGRVLLFERLCMDAAPDTARPQGPLRAQEIEDVAGSVLRELRNLLNTRLPSAAGMSDESSQTIINYGLPDFAMLNASGEADRESLARLIENKIAGFEPRLTQVRVFLWPHPIERNAVAGAMEALLQIESISEPIRFPLSAGSSGVFVAQATDAV